MFSFLGIHGIMKNDEEELDSVMVYQKGGWNGKNRRYYS